MGKVVAIGISEKSGNEIINVNKVDALMGKGLAEDRHCKENNDQRCQITMIEIEKINQYNKLNKTSIPAIKFRRNIVTENINLNNLIGKEFFIGKVKIKAHDQCKPCKNLQDDLKQNNIVKEFLNSGGLRCEILSNGQIIIGDLIKI